MISKAGALVRFDGSAVVSASPACRLARSGREAACSAPRFTSPPIPPAHPELAA